MKKSNEIKLVDCTLRDGGYYNSWDFSQDLINKYLAVMKSAYVDVVELGFRFLKNEGFKGPCAFTTDSFLRNLNIPSDLTIGVMVNGADLYTEIGWQAAMEYLFPEPSYSTPVGLVRFACHFHELPNALSAARWLVDRGYRVGLNLMQISDRTQAEVEQFGELANAAAIEVLYFADSMGSLRPDDTVRTIGWLRTHWSGSLGIHAHDNMGLALANTLHAQAEGATWLDATLTGMGRGPGNLRMEELLIEAEVLRGVRANVVPMMSLIRTYFKPMQAKYGWGPNPYYYLAGKYGIHPSYVQEMLSSSRYADEDIIAVVEYLRKEGGKKFSLDILEGAKLFYRGEPCGNWAPVSVMKSRELLILAAGTSVLAHRKAIEAYIRHAKPIVIALNAQQVIEAELIDYHIACHPIRLLADADRHKVLVQPLIAPVSMFPEVMREALKNKNLLDFGFRIGTEFEFHLTYCVAPSSLVLSYALAVACSGRVSQIKLAGFDGYGSDDPRHEESERVFEQFLGTEKSISIQAITPTSYNIPASSIYALIR